MAASVFNEFGYYLGSQDGDSKRKQGIFEEAEVPKSASVDAGGERREKSCQLA